MSYARVGKDSDVYIFNNGEYFEIYYPVKLNKNPEKCESINELYKKLMLLQKEGLKVSKDTLKRVKKEMAKE